MANATPRFAFTTVAFLLSAATSTASHLADVPSADPQANAGLFFEPNVGQLNANANSDTNTDADFIARTSGASLLLRADQFILNAASSLHVHLIGARADAKPTAGRLRGTISDYRGSDPKDWHLNIPTYGRVQYANIYAGIDIAYHPAPQGFEYDFLLAPGADPRNIRLQLDGADNLTLTDEGTLTATLQGAGIIQPKPIAYQLNGQGARTNVPVSYQLDAAAHTVTFQLGAYDPSRALTIDPLAYSVLYGQKNMAHHMVVDAAGNAYVAGELQTFATTPNTDAVVTKFAPDGTLLWEQIFRGAGADDTDIAKGIAIDSTGTKLFIAGSTLSKDFPTTATAFSKKCGDSFSVITGTAPLNQGCANGSDAFIMQLDAATGTMIYSTFFGGGFDDTANAITVDAGGNVYITGTSAQLPGRGTSRKTPSQGGQCPFDAYLAKFDLSKTGAAALIFSIPIGGDGNDEGNALAIPPGEVFLPSSCTQFPCRLAPVGTIYLAGTTGYATTINSVSGKSNPTSGACATGMNAPFPTTPNAFSSDGGALLPQAFIAMFDSTGSQLIYSSLFMASTANGIAVVPQPASAHHLRFAQPLSSAVITGNTGNISTHTGAFQPNFGGGTSDAYVAGFDPTKSGTASLVMFTYLGGSGNEQGNDIAIDPTGTLIVAGATDSTNFPLRHNVIRTLRPVQGTFATPTCGGNIDCTDAFVATLSAKGDSEGYATYLGGSGIDTASAVAVCNTTACGGYNIYFAGTTFSPNFPVTGGTFSGGPDQFVAKIFFPQPRVITFPIIKKP